MFANGTLNIENGGSVSSSAGFIAGRPASTSSVTVSGNNSVWETHNLRVGSSAGGDGTLNIQSGGLVTVNVNTKIYSQSRVNLSSGGRFEFGGTTLDEFTRINATGGSLSGSVSHDGYSDMGTLVALKNTAADLSEVSLSNSGVLFGDASLQTALRNLNAGELETLAGERVRFAGVGNVNAGEINNFGGSVRFDQDLTNENTGFISGRGQFIANGGWANQGVMAFSGGNTDLLGDIVNSANGQIVTSGGATTTFYDDVDHNGLEIRTAAGSNSVFFGQVSGAGDFTGTGSVYFEGDLRPGNSPNVVSFEGDVIMGTLASMHVELAGEQPGAFDQLLIAGDLSLDGGLWVDLIDGFELTANQEFVIADVGGELLGQFAGLNEGDLIGNYSGRDLFISYGGGDGNDVALFTAIPEPQSAAFCICVGLSLLLRRRRSIERKSSPLENRK